MVLYNGCKTALVKGKERKSIYIAPFCTKVYTKHSGMDHTVLPAKPLWHDLEPVDINSQWRESWKSALVVNAHLVDDPTIRHPGFVLVLVVAVALKQW